MDRGLSIVKIILRPGVFYSGEWRENVGPHGNGCEHYADQSRFEGKWFNGKRHGPGKEFDSAGKLKRDLFFVNGNLYVGDLKPGAGPCGFGDEFSLDGKCVYRGEWINGQRCGKSYSEGTLRYDGEWRGDKQHGFGKLYEDGVLVYEGHWLEGKRQGQGTEYVDGCMVYRGQWRQDIKNGLGKEYVTSKHATEQQLVAVAEQVSVAPNQYVAVAEAEQTSARLFREGEWKDGKFVSGKEYGEHGLEFQGFWLDEKPHGLCTQYKNGSLFIEGTWNNGELTSGKEFKDGQVVYDGQWYQASREGQGKELQNGAVVYDGKWKLGMRDGAGIEFADGKISYDGEWRGGKKEGCGKSYHAQSANLWYNGEWKEDAKAGQGSLFDKQGFLVFEGNWEGDLRHGYGREYQDGFLIYEGQWAEGLRDGKGRLYSNGKFVSEALFAKGDQVPE